MVLALKQICNHPTQYLKNRVMDPSLSGKTEMLLDIVSSIYDSGEKALIFTQYTEMGNMLRHFIAETQAPYQCFCTADAPSSNARKWWTGFRATDRTAY